MGLSSFSMMLPLRLRHSRVGDAPDPHRHTLERRPGRTQRKRRQKLDSAENEGQRHPSSNVSTSEWPYALFKIERNCAKHYATAHRGLARWIPKTTRKNSPRTTAPKIPLKAARISNPGTAGGIRMVDLHRATPVSPGAAATGPRGLLWTCSAVPPIS